ncbi:hypothetical protein EDD75_0318 [Thermodesulfitimonas autotrophica]|uniref:Uncharacterized protein n=1 Tax=Thermodesulfitimonas autotrophica TaxID=1894989 RepID=A0A3N5BPF2_9THEO|nr:hypothetical protein [Thermodesulfitimonas autotrophica]RPF49502.1 hypothetical protein EDD75_0318 [Thermodesulfitimonas autotrophica]
MFVEAFIASEQALERLENRLRALKTGDSETDCLVETVVDTLRHYLFLSSAAAAYRQSPEFPSIAADLLREEGEWPHGTHPDVLAVFETLKNLELVRQKVRRGNKEV